jgi:hypothetical protein
MPAWALEWDSAMEWAWGLVSELESASELALGSVWALESELLSASALALALLSVSALALESEWSPE